MPRASSTPARPGLRPMSTSNSRKAAGARTRRRCAGAPPARRSSGPPRRSTPSAGNLLAPLAGRGGRATRLPRGGPARPAQHGTEHDADLAALAPPDLGADHGAAGRQMELEDARDGERIGKRQPRAAAREVPDRAIDRNRLAPKMTLPARKVRWRWLSRLSSMTASPELRRDGSR